VLGDDGDVVAEVLDVDSAERPAVEEDSTGLGLVETLKKSSGGGLARTGSTAEG
jgi:hypothetical protein